MRRMLDPQGPPTSGIPARRRERFINSVTRGKNQMPPWGDLLKPEEVEALWLTWRRAEKSDSAPTTPQGSVPTAMSRSLVWVRVSMTEPSWSGRWRRRACLRRREPHVPRRWPTGMVATMAFVAVSSTETDASPPLEM